jgi:hypothetical protein
MASPHITRFPLPRIPVHHTQKNLSKKRSQKHARSCTHIRGTHHFHPSIHFKSSAYPLSRVRRQTLNPLPARSAPPPPLPVQPAISFSCLGFLSRGPRCSGAGANLSGVSLGFRVTRGAPPPLPFLVPYTPSRPPLSPPFTFATHFLGCFLCAAQHAPPPFSPSAEAPGLTRAWPNPFEPPLSECLPPMRPHTSPLVGPSFGPPVPPKWRGLGRILLLLYMQPPCPFGV